jgi:hypothetical protein
MTVRSILLASAASAFSVVALAVAVFFLAGN